MELQAVHFYIAQINYGEKSVSRLQLWLHISKCLICTVVTKRNYRNWDLLTFRSSMQESFLFHSFPRGTFKRKQINYEILIAINTSWRTEKFWHETIEANFTLLSPSNCQQEKFSRAAKFIELLLRSTKRKRSQSSNLSNKQAHKLIT